MELKKYYCLQMPCKKHLFRTEKICFCFSKETKQYEFNYCLNFNELIHLIREQSPEKFYALADYLMDSFSELGCNVMQIIRHLQYEDPTLTFDDAYERIVANAIEGTLSNENIETVVTQYQGKTQNPIRKALQIVKQMISISSKNKINCTPPSPQSEAGKAVVKMNDRLDNIRHLYADGLADMKRHCECDACMICRREATKKLHELFMQDSAFYEKNSIFLPKLEQ